MESGYEKMKQESEIALRQNEDTQSENMRLKNMIEKIKKHCTLLQNEHTDMQLKYDKMKQTYMDNDESEITEDDEDELDAKAPRKSRMNEDFLNVDESKNSLGVCCRLIR